MLYDDYDFSALEFDDTDYNEEIGRINALRKWESPYDENEVSPYYDRPNFVENMLAYKYIQEMKY